MKEYFKNVDAAAAGESGVTKGNIERNCKKNAGKTLEYVQAGHWCNSEKGYVFLFTNED